MSSARKGGAAGDVVEQPLDDAPPGVRAASHNGTSALVSRYGVIFVLVTLVVAFCVLLPQTFATIGNFQVMVNSQAVVLILALAASIPLRTGDFDLSIANVMTISACLLGVLTGAGVPALLAVVLVLALGMVAGFVNGLLVVKVGVDAFIATLGMLTALSGAAFAITDGRRVDTYPQALSSVVNTELFGLPLLTYYAWLLVLVLWFVYECTPLGRRLLFIGGSRESARLAGVRVDRVRIGAFVSSAALSSLAGILLAGSLGAIDPGIGSAYLLPPFAAVFLGATTIKVGRYNAFGTVAGLYLLVVGITGLQLFGVPAWVSDVFNGVALVLAVSLAIVAGRRNRG